MTQRIEPFSIGLKDLMLFSLTQRIELFLTRTDRIGPFSWIWLRELNFFLGFLHVYFFQKWCRELNPFFFEYDAKNWTFFFFECDAKNWTLFSLNVTSRIGTFFLNMTQRIEPFSYLKQRNELLFLWYEWLQELFFQTKNTQWIELFEIWLKELNIWTMCQKEDSESGTLLKFFFEMTHRIEPFFLNLFKMTQRVEVFFQYDSKNWTLCFSQNVSKNWTFFFSKNAQRIEPLFHLNYFFTWLNELNFFQFDSKSWVFSNMTQRVGFFFFWIWLKNLNLRLSMTQRSDPFWTWLKEVNFFEHYSENRTLFLRRRKELNLFLNLTQRIDFSQNDAKNWNLFSKYDAKNWNFFFFWIWLKELNFFFWYDSKKWNLKKDSKSWTCFFF